MLNVEEKRLFLEKDILLMLNKKLIMKKKKKKNKKNIKYKLVKGKDDDDINEGLVFKDQKIYMYTPKYDEE